MSSLAARPDVNGTVEQLMSGELFTALQLDDREQRASALEAVLGTVVDDDTRVVWVGNPLRSPLTIERFLIQIVGPEIDLREERGPAELARIVAAPVGRETRLIIVVQQPETIGAELREALVGMGGRLSGEAIQVQFLFAGPSSFALPRLAKPAFMAFSSSPPAPDPAQSDEPPLGPRRRDVLPLLVLLLAITLGVVISVAPASKDGIPPGPEMTRPVQLIPPLQRQFDAFLEERIRPPLTEAEKSALFQEFLTHHRRE